MTAIFVEVADHNQAEAACSELALGLRHQMDGFPEGEVVAVDVDHYELATDEEHQRYFAE